MKLAWSQLALSCDDGSAGEITETLASYTGRHHRYEPDEIQQREYINDSQYRANRNATSASGCAIIALDSDTNQTLADRLTRGTLATKIINCGD
jgi:UDP-N-acetylmuramoylalanine-D-glutamate ligase